MQETYGMIVLGIIRFETMKGKRGDLIKDVEIDVMAILNDTVGTLMACAFKENSCQVI